MREEACKSGGSELHNCVHKCVCINDIHCLFTEQMGVHLSPLPPLQGVVTYTSPVEVFATGIKNVERWKSSLITWLLLSEALDRLILQEFKGQNVAMPAKYLRKCVDRLILVAQNSSWSLDWLLKRTLIVWFHFDSGCKRFYRRCLCDYPLSYCHG